MPAWCFFIARHEATNKKISFIRRTYTREYSQKILAFLFAKIDVSATQNKTFINLVILRAEFVLNAASLFR